MVGPALVMTVTVTVPEPDGATAVTLCVLTDVNDVAACDPNFTALTPTRAMPVIVTVVPAAPEDGETDDTTGVHVQAAPDAAPLCPREFVTNTSVLPTPLGATAVIFESFTIVNDVASMLPNLTALAVPRS